MEGRVTQDPAYNMTVPHPPIKSTRNMVSSQPQQMRQFAAYPEHYTSRTVPAAAPAFCPSVEPRKFKFPILWTRLLPTASTAPIGFIRLGPFAASFSTLKQLDRCTIPHAHRSLLHRHFRSEYEAPKQRLVPAERERRPLEEVDSWW